MSVTDDAKEHLFQIKGRFSSGVSFTQEFKQQINAELFVREVAYLTPHYEVECNFEPKFSNEELDAHKAHMDRLVREFTRLEMQCKARTILNFKNPDSFPCEVCGEKHRNYECCEACNHQRHTCHFCGDDLGHREISVCYLLPHWEE